MAEGKELAMAIGILTLSSDDMYVVGYLITDVAHGSDDLVGLLV